MPVPLGRHQSALAHSFVGLNIPNNRWAFHSGLGPGRCLGGTQSLFSKHPNVILGGSVEPSLKWKLQLSTYHHWSLVPSCTDVLGTAPFLF